MGQQAALLLVLDGVTDPPNLVAYLHCADDASIHTVIVQGDRAAPLNSPAKKIASSAAETLSLIRVTNLACTLHRLQDHNVWIVGSADEADYHLYQRKLTGSLVLLMGAEGKGMRLLTREHCDELIRMSMAGEVSSFNVSVSTGVWWFESVW